ncbi:MAG: response regulator [Shewanella sp.]
MNTGLTCIIVDDHPLIRMALKATLLNVGVDVIAECDNGDDALKAILALVPDIVLLDLDLPGIDGLTLLKHLGDYGLPSRIIVLSASDSEHLAARVRAAGAHGYWHKSESLEQLLVVFKLVNRFFKK